MTADDGVSLFGFWEIPRRVGAAPRGGLAITPHRLRQAQATLGGPTSDPPTGLGFLSTLGPPPMTASLLRCTIWIGLFYEGGPSPSRTSAQARRPGDPQAMVKVPGMEGVDASVVAEGRLLAIKMIRFFCISVR